MYKNLQITNRSSSLTYNSDRLDSPPVAGVMIRLKFIAAAVYSPLRLVAFQNARHTQTLVSFTQWKAAVNSILRRDTGWGRWPPRSCAVIRCPTPSIRPGRTAYSWRCCAPTSASPSISSVGVWIVQRKASRRRGKNVVSVLVRPGIPSTTSSVVWSVNRMNSVTWSRKEAWGRGIWGWGWSCRWRFANKSAAEMTAAICPAACK